LACRKTGDRAWTISQDKFNLEMGLAEAKATTWTVPLTYQSLRGGRDAGQPASFLWLSNQTARVTAPTSLVRDTYLFNVGKFLSSSRQA